MRAVTYKSVVDAVEGLALGSYGQRSNSHWRPWNVLINRWVQQFWEAGWWPEWTGIEKRQFRASWSASTTYAAGTEIYYPPTEGYYQSAQGTNLNHLPDETGSAWWAPSASSYEGADWLTGTVYAASDTVRNPADDLYYYCHTGHTAGATFDSTKFRVLTPFLRSIDYDSSTETDVGDVLCAWDAHPDLFPEARRIQCILRDELIVCGSVPVVYLEFRQRCPDYTGDAWASGSYAVGDQVYYETTGDFYRCIATATTQAPSDTSKWEKIQFPYVLKAPVAQAVYSEILRSTGQTEAAVIEEQRALKYLDKQLRNSELRQGQSRRLPVKTR